MKAAFISGFFGDLTKIKLKTSTRLPFKGFCACFEPWKTKILLCIFTENASKSLWICAEK